MNGPDLNDLLERLGRRAASQGLTIEELKVHIRADVLALVGAVLPRGGEAI
jgi:hypothetical protein